MGAYWPGILMVLCGIVWIVGMAIRDFKSYDPPVQIHVTYNSITNGHSKYAVGNPPREWIVTGQSRDKALYRCRVTREFYEAVEENSHVLIPQSQCEEVSPRITEGSDAN